MWKSKARSSAGPIYWSWRKTQRKRPERRLAAKAALPVVLALAAMLSAPSGCKQGGGTGGGGRNVERPALNEASGGRAIRTRRPKTETAGLPSPEAAHLEKARREKALKSVADAMRARLGGDFIIRYEWPFVAAGNIAPKKFNAIFKNSLAGCYRCLRRDYFEAEPTKPIAVYLFRNETDYKRYAKELFGDTAQTPFGYYSPSHRALIMNIATGTGTLVHELCHPLIERDFPRCPTWLNEGLASLHEQCIRRGDSLVGLPNWRLPALQEAIRSGAAPALEALLDKTTPDKFYGGDDEALNYAAARYLCLYLQERGKLKEFYSRLKSRIGEDPTGLKTLEKLLGAPLAQVEPAWRRWVLALHYP